ncbi:MAG: phasin family protein [Rhodobacteraceae bacterium]|nr:phasin family protein [Paracoccaceae bacterium]
MSRKTASEIPALPDPLSAFAAIDGLRESSLKALSMLGTNWMYNISGFTTEVAQFLAERLQQDLQLQHRLLHCKDMDELRQVQSDFVRAALEQYMAETGKLVHLGTDMVAGKVPQ